MPMWMAFVGGVFGIGLGSAVGGLGQNAFNPALRGAFLQAASGRHDLAVEGVPALRDRFAPRDGNGAVAPQATPPGLM
jgi:hypothetical protein